MTPSLPLLPLLLLALAAAARAQVGSTVPVRAGVPWPLPVSFSNGSSTVAFPDGGPRFELCAACDAGVLRRAFARFATRLAPSSACAEAAAAPLVSVVAVCCGDPGVSYPAPGTDESYSLRLTAAAEANVTAANPFGALHALETLAQLADLGGCGLVRNAPVSVDDAPRFGYRGLLVDTSRHYLPPSFLRHVVDGLAAARLNVLHWHAVDSNSFPLSLPGYEALARRGAWSPGAVYTSDDVAALVAYARDRGVRVLVEVDVPGHGGWGGAYPGLMACPGVLDPTQNATYDLLAGFLGRVLEVAPDPYLFLGGDEVRYKCFDANPAVAAWLAARNMTSAELPAYFWRRVVADVLPRLRPGLTLSVWESDRLQFPPAGPDALPNSTVYNVYESLATAGALVSQGRPVVLSVAYDGWYLDTEPPCSRGGIDQYNALDWECAYRVSPVPANWTAAEKALVLGGEAAMWGEGVSRANFDATAWRPLAAVAERLWSPAAATSSTVAARPRLAAFLCGLNARGFGAGAVGPGFCPADVLS